MRNKLLAALLALCMVMALLPATVFADENGSEDKNEEPPVPQSCYCGCGFDCENGCSYAKNENTGLYDKTCYCDYGNACDENCKYYNATPPAPGPAPKSCYCGCALSDCSDCCITLNSTTGRYDYHCGCEEGGGNCGCGEACNFTQCVCGCKVSSCSACGYDTTAKQPVCGCGGSPETCKCGKENLAPEGHCMCEESSCTAPSHTGEPLGTVGDKQYSYGAVCVTIPEDGGTLCSACKAYAASLNGSNQDDGKKDEQPKPTTPTAPAADPTAPKKAEDFSDVPAGMWYNDNLTTMLEKGWFVGQAGGTFAPQNATTGSEVVVILSRVLGEDLVTTGANWAAEATAWAAESGLSEGITISASGLARQDLILMLWRAAGKPESSQALTFTDIGGVSGDALTALRWAVEKGIVNGNPDGTANPNGATKRCEMAALMVRYDKAVNG